MITDRDVERLKKYAEELKNAGAHAKTFYSGMIGDAGKLADKLFNLKSKQDKVNSSIERIKSASGRGYKAATREILWSLDDVQRKYIEVAQKSGKTFVEALEEINKHNNKIMTSMKGELLEINRVVKNVANSTERNFTKAFKNAYKENERLVDSMREYQGLTKSQKRDKVLELTNPKLAEKVKDIKEAGTVGSSTKKGELMGKILGKVPGVGGTFGKIQGMTDSARGYSQLFTAMAAGTKNASALTGALDYLSIAMKSMGKAGWIGLLITAIVELGKAINTVDKFIKGLNKDFLSIAGPASTLDNFTGSMKDFNNALYASSNVKLGLTAKDVYGLFEAINKAGLSSQGVGERVSRYGDSIETARKLSVQFGVSLNDMGSMMANQMLDLRSSLKDVSSTFDVLAYDAGKAGIQSDKFYQSVDAASSSLSFYGNYLKKASGMLRDFSTSGTMGFKDAAKQATDMMGLYKNLSKTQKFAIISMLGPKKVEEILTGISTELKNKTEDIANKIKKNKAAQETAPEDKKKELKDELLILEKEESIAKANMIRNKYALKQGDIYDKAEALLGSVEKTPEWILTLLKISGQDIFANSLSAQTFLERTFGVTAEIFDKFKTDILVMQDVFNEFNKKFKENTDKLSDAEIAKVSDVLSAYNPDIEDSVKDTKSKLAPLLSGVIKDAGELEKFINLLMRYSRSKDVTTGIKGGNIAGLLKGNLDEYQIKAAAESTSVTSGVEGVAPIKSRDLSNIIKKMTPLETYFKISKEALGYNIASSDAATNTVNLLSDIYIKISEIAVSVGKIATFWLLGGGKNKEDLTKDTPYIKALAKNEAIAQTGVQSALDELLKKSPDAGISVEDIPDIYKKWSGTKEDKKEITDIFKDVPLGLLTNLMDAYSKKVQSSDKLNDLTSKYGTDLQSEVTDLVNLSKNEGLTSSSGVAPQSVKKTKSIYGSYVSEAEKLRIQHAMNPGPTDWDKTKKFVKDFFNDGKATWGSGLVTGESPALMTGGGDAGVTNQWGGIVVNTNGGDLDKAAIPELQVAFQKSLKQAIYENSLKKMNKK